MTYGDMLEVLPLARQTHVVVGRAFSVCKKLTPIPARRMPGVPDTCALMAGTNLTRTFTEEFYPREQALNLSQVSAIRSPGCVISVQGLAASVVPSMAGEMGRTLRWLYSGDKINY